MDPKEIERLIEQGMTAESVSVSGAEGKYTATVVSDEFEGLSTLKRHKLVYACVNAQIASGELHALTIVAKTAAETA